MIAKLEAEFNIPGKVVDLDLKNNVIPNAVSYFNLNLINKYTLSLGFRRKLHCFANVALIAITLVFIFVFAKALKLDDQIKTLKNDTDPSKKVVEYGSKISDLQSKIKLLENEK